MSKELRLAFSFLRLYLCVIFSILRTCEGATIYRLGGRGGQTSLTEHKGRSIEN